MLVLKVIKMNNNVWLDVTTMIGWQRSAVGIVRTEIECAKYALECVRENKNVRFCIFSKSTGYSEVSSDIVLKKIERISGNEKTQQALSNKEVKQAISSEQRAKVIVFKVISILPNILQKKVFSFLVLRKPAAINFISALRSFKLALNLWFKPSKINLLNFNALENLINKDGITHPFSAGDEYISLGLDWDQKDFSYLYHLKKELNLKVKLFCYDVIPVKLPHLCVGDVAGKFGHYFSDVAWCADEIFCISECSKKDLHELLLELGTPIPKMTVIKLGCELPFFNEELPINDNVASILNQKYILFVSTIERRKNHDVLYKAYTRLIDSNVNDIPLLIFVGMQGWGMGDFISDITLDPRVKNKIMILNNVSDPDLTRLYKNCWFTVYPSLYEGWGLPVAESLAFGKYCLASRAASIPEVGGALLDYLDPWDVPEWEENIHYFIKNPDEIVKKERIIKERYALTKWQDTARIVINV